LEDRKGWHFCKYISNAQNSKEYVTVLSLATEIEHFHGDHRAFIAKKE
jgi:hypothetical protein